LLIEFFGPLSIFSLPPALLFGWNSSLRPCPNPPSADDAFDFLDVLGSITVVVKLEAERALYEREVRKILDAVKRDWERMGERQNGRMMERVKRKTGKELELESKLSKLSKAR
jgi:uncharacterized protein YqgV (UPF0045/DUF77 family)